MLEINLESLPRTLNLFVNGVQQPTYITDIPEKVKFAFSIADQFASFELVKGVRINSPTVKRLPDANPVSFNAEDTQPKQQATSTLDEQGNVRTIFFAHSQDPGVLAGTDNRIGISPLAHRAVAFVALKEELKEGIWRIEGKMFLNNRLRGAGVINLTEADGPCYTLGVHGGSVCYDGIDGFVGKDAHWVVGNKPFKNSDIVGLELNYNEDPSSLRFFVNGAEQPVSVINVPKGVHFAFFLSNALSSVDVTRYMRLRQPTPRSNSIPHIPIPWDEFSNYIPSSSPFDFLAQAGAISGARSLGSPPPSTAVSLPQGVLVVQKDPFHLHPYDFIPSTDPALRENANLGALVKRLKNKESNDDVRRRAELINQSTGELAIFEITSGKNTEMTCIGAEVRNINDADVSPVVFTIPVPFYSGRWVIEGFYRHSPNFRRFGVATAPVGSLDEYQLGGDNISIAYNGTDGAIISRACACRLAEPYAEGDTVSIEIDTEYRVPPNTKLLPSSSLFPAPRPTGPVTAVWFTHKGIRQPIGIFGKMPVLYFYFAIQSKGSFQITRYQRITGKFPSEAARANATGVPPPPPPKPRRFSLFGSRQSSPPPETLSPLPPPPSNVTMIPFETFPQIVLAEYITSAFNPRPGPPPAPPRGPAAASTSSAFTPSLVSFNLPLTYPLKPEHLQKLPLLDLQVLAFDRMEKERIPLETLSNAPSVSSLVPRFSFAPSNRPEANNALRARALLTLHTLATHSLAIQTFYPVNIRTIDPSAKFKFLMDTVTFDQDEPATFLIGTPFTSGIWRMELNFIGTKKLMLVAVYSMLSTFHHTLLGKDTSNFVVDFDDGTCGFDKAWTSGAVVDKAKNDDTIAFEVNMDAEPKWLHMFVNGKPQSVIALNVPAQLSFAVLLADQDTGFRVSRFERLLVPTPFTPSFPVKIFDFNHPQIRSMPSTTTLPNEYTFTSSLYSSILPLTHASEQLSRHILPPDNPSLRPFKLTSSLNEMQIVVSPHSAFLCDPVAATTVVARADYGQKIWRWEGSIVKSHHPVIGVVFGQKSQHSPGDFGLNVKNIGYDGVTGCIIHNRHTFPGNQTFTSADRIAMELNLQKQPYTLFFFKNNQVQPVYITNLPDQTMFAFLLSSPNESISTRVFTTLSSPSVTPSSVNIALDYHNLSEHLATLDAKANAAGHFPWPALTWTLPAEALRCAGPETILLTDTTENFCVHEPITEGIYRFDFLFYGPMDQALALATGTLRMLTKIPLGNGPGSVVYNFFDGSTGNKQLFIPGNDEPLPGQTVSVEINMLNTDLPRERRTAVFAINNKVQPIFIKALPDSVQLLVALRKKGSRFICLAGRRLDRPSLPPPPPDVGSPCTFVDR